MVRCPFPFVTPNVWDAALCVLATRSRKCLGICAKVFPSDLSGKQGHGKHEFSNSAPPLFSNLAKRAERTFKQFTSRN